METVSTITMAEFITKACKSEARKLLVPMELSAGWPSVSIKRGNICITLPFYKMQPSADGQVLLFPLSYSMTLTWPSGVVVAFSALKYDKAYKGVHFDKPVGFFKHEAVKHWSKEAYIAKRSTLYTYYDALLSGMVNKKTFDDVAEMRALLQCLMEPSLYPMYKHIAKNFYETYCGL